MFKWQPAFPCFSLRFRRGAIADIVDKRRFLIVTEIVVTLVAAASAVLVWLGYINPPVLLLFTFLLGVGAAFTAPAWQSVVPSLVPRQDLAAAVASNGVGVNISRAIGPALGGVIIGGLGIAAPFRLNALSNFGVIGALWWWRPSTSGDQCTSCGTSDERLGRRTSPCPVQSASAGNADKSCRLLLLCEHLLGAASACRAQPDRRGPALYGILLGAVGAGAVGGAFGLPWMKATFGPDRLVALGTAGTAISLIMFGFARESVVALVACIVAGISWIAVLATLNVSAQVSLPDWVRGRGLAMFVTVFFGAMTAGSVTWGQVASMLGLPAAHFIAAGGALIGIVLSWSWKLQGGSEMDLTPSMHWPVPVLTIDAEPDRGPVLITVEYHINPERRRAFLTALQELGQQRRRDGAYAWDIFEDAAQKGRFMETFPCRVLA